MNNTFRFVALLVTLGMQACASFDKTNILPGQRVVGPGFSFEVPTTNSWFTVEYGTSHRLKLSQLNHEDSYAITASLNRGPGLGAYDSAQAHLEAYRDYINRKEPIEGYQRLSHEIDIAQTYGELCIMFKESAQDWRGRNNAGPAVIERIKLICAHPYFNNVLASFEILHRHEKDTNAKPLWPYAERLFASIEYSDYSD